MSAWTLTIGGTTQSLAAWRVNGVNLIRRNLSADLLTFTAPRAAFDADPLCAYGDSITLTDPDGNVWFVGERQLNPSDLGNGESQSYSFIGPWRWLAENIFQQPWFNSTVYTSHILFVGTVGGNIKAVLDYAIANGANLQYVLAELTALAALPPTNEFTEKYCASCLLDNLQFMPDTVTWFDYTTTPPTLHFQQRGSLTAATLRLASYTANTTYPKAAALRLTPRPDLQIPSAKINYEVIETVDGTQYLIPSVDVYPADATGREDGAFNATVTLQGRNVTNVFGEIECLTIDSSSLDWWKLHVPKLADATRIQIYGGPSDIRAYDMDGVALDLTTLYPRELLEGQIADWMELEDGTPVAWQRIVLKARFAYNETDGAGNLTKAEQDGEYSIEMVTTNAPNGVSDYSATASIEDGDNPTAGLAQYLYESLAPLQYEASFTLTEEECTGTVDLGNVVNLVGSRTEYASMRALVQEVAFDLDNGVTSITCGPPRHLTLSDVLALLQRFRVRRRWTNPDTQDTGELGTTNGDVTLGRATPNNSSGTGAEAPKYTAVVYIGTQNTQKVSLNAENEQVKLEGTRDIVLSGALGSFTMGAKSGTTEGNVNISIADTGGRAIRLRVMPVCVNGEVKSVIGLFSPVF